jgi:transcriptional regulator with XRE-family HTH domain
MLTPRQCAAARAWLGWTREELAERAGVSAGTVVAFETLGSDPKVSTLQKLRRAFAQEGIELIEEGVPSLDGGPGLRLRKGVPVKGRKGA